MTKPITFTYKDRTYTTEPDPNGWCAGCAFITDNSGCRDNSAQYDCCGEQTIFVIKQKLYTVEEVLRCYWGYQITQPSNPYAEAQIAKIEKDLDKVNDPEYTKYLELKKKYEA